MAVGPNSFEFFDRLVSAESSVAAVIEIGALALRMNVPTAQDLNVDRDPLIARDDIAQGIGLRILPLGASIIAGDGSSDGNGFRSYLEQKLAGSKMQYVGSLRSGSMSNNYHEGHFGFGVTLVALHKEWRMHAYPQEYDADPLIYSQIADAAAASIDFRPNIILLHVGTNDLLQGSSDMHATSMRLGNLVDYLLAKFADATILLAQLVAARDPGHNARIAAYNSQMSSLVSSRAGKHIILVDMTVITADQLTADGIHPNDAAYEIMASQWHKGIQNAVAQGWVKDPIGPDPQPNPNNPNQSCINRRSLEILEPRGFKTGHQCASGVNWSQVGKIARGDGANGDHKFNPNWIRRGGAGDPLSRDGSRMVFADLRGTGRSDRVLVAAEDGTLFAWLNNGDGTNIMWKPANDGKQIFDGKCTLDRMRFADLTDSGKADLVCIVGTNTVGKFTELSFGFHWKSAQQLTLRATLPEAYFNQYTPSGGFRWDGPHQISNGVAGTNRDSIYFMDVDGNGRDDMIVKRPNGELHAMLNFGKPKNIRNIDWHDVGQIAPSIGTGNIAFADLNNDGRDDIVAFNGDGSMYSFLNIRGLEAGRPMWVRQDEIKGTEDWAPADLRISDVTGDGKADYIHMDPQNGGFDLFVNDGTADVNVVGDGTWLADMDGDGLDDRVWITEDGRISVWLNGQANAQAPFGWDWFAQNNKQPVVSGINAEREQYRLADIDGDGKADLVVIELKTGAISAWINKGPDTDASPQGWVWAPVGQIGVSVANAANAHFADVTGDGKADLIWLDEASMLTIYRNDYDSQAHHWSWPKSTETPIDLRIQNPKDIRFADIDGDQKADAIVIHPWDGAAVVWLNRDSSKPEGWVRSVPSPGTSDPSHPPCAADNVQFARVSVPYGRADYVIIDPNDGALSLWKNGCRNYAPGSSGMTDHPKNDIMSPDTNQQKAPSVSCGDLIVPTGGAGSKESTITTSRGFPGKTLISKRATASPVPIIENSDGQLQVPVSPPPSLVAKPPSPGSQANPTNGKPSAAVVAGGRTLTPGAAPVIISGTTYSLASTSRPMVVVNGAISTLPTLQAAVTGPGGSISGSLVSGQRTPSRSATTSSRFLAVVPVIGSLSRSSPTSASSRIISSVARATSTRTVTPYQLVVVIGSDTIGVQSTGFVAGSRTVKPGSAITFSGHTLSLDSQSAKLIGDGTTITIPTRTSRSSTATPIRPSPSPSRPSPIIVGSEIIHPESLTSTGFTIGNQTIRPGASSTTISGQTFSLDSSANLHVGTTTKHVGSQDQGTSTSSVSTSTITDVAALNDTASNDTDIYVPASKWDELLPEVAIAAGVLTTAAGGLVNLILPPRRLRVPTTIKFPPYTTSLEIAWQEVKEIESGGKKFLSTKFESMTQKTTLSIPSMVTDREEYWNIRLPKGLKATKVFPTPSYQPRPFIIEEDRNPLNQKGVRHPLVRRTITPPSWPYSVPTKFPVFPPAVNIVSQAADQVGGLVGGGRGGGPLGQKCGGSEHAFVETKFQIFKYIIVLLRNGHGHELCGVLRLDHIWFDELHQFFGVLRFNNLGFNELQDPSAFPVISIDPNEDQGDDGTLTTSTSSSSCTASSMVTNYVVSCASITSGSSSCKTVSTSVNRGCGITGTTPTTSSRSSCPTASLDPEEDQGEDGKPSTSSKSSSSSSCTATSMVTNFVVSCASATSGSSKSCRTVSTSVKRGCSITGTTTTTSSAASCPTIILDPDEDQGQDGEPSTSTTSKSSSSSCTTTSMVTDYVVSCAKATSGSSSSCRTVSTSVKRGCSISATTTTTSSAASCPTISLDPNEDQGEDGEPSIRSTGKVSTRSKSSASTKASSTNPSTTKASSSTQSSTTKPSSSPTSSTSRPPPSSPLKTSPPPTYTEPPLPIYQFAVGWFLEGVFGKDIGYSKNAIYFDKYSEDAQWVCRDDTALWEQDKNGPRSPKYPIIIGPFDAQPWTDCAYYRESDKTDGLLTCVGNRYRQDGKCKAVDEGNKIECSEAAEKKQIRWTTQQVCTMEGGLSGGEVNPDTGPEFCYNATFNGEPAVGTVTTINKDAMKALIDDSCDKAKDWKFETFKDLRGNPTMRLEMTSKVKEGKKQPKWSKKNCKDMFGQLNLE
ncbi:MAG: hypothetical protein Q9210_005893, partial [Variospora velana]